LRSALRWASKLDRPDIEKLLRQAGALRDEVMQLSHKERFVNAAAAEPTRSDLSRRQRRTALIERSFIFEGAFGDNPKLLEALETAEKVAPTGLPVLIDGESGTGKELMAKVIHANGHRADRPFVSVNCGAIPENLLESELFGHCKGAFTGAVNDRKGKFESAHTGTIFLDEIGELPLAGQVKLLRVLEAHEIQRVGSDQPIRVDARVVAATNRNLRKLSEEGRFREDLFYRLGVIHVTLPPLRERKDEIPLLFEFFGDEAAEVLKRRPIEMTRRLRAFLLDYAYPGNIRELRNIVYRLSCLAGQTADIEHLPADIRPASRATLASYPASDDDGPSLSGDALSEGQACRKRPGRARIPRARTAGSGRNRGRAGEALQYESIASSGVAEEARHSFEGVSRDLASRQGHLSCVTAHAVWSDPGFSGPRHAPPRP